MLLYPLMGFKGGFSIFFIWSLFELGIRTLFKKEISCPHCGFDASLYKKDIKMTRKLVENFWLEKSQTTKITENEKNEEENLKPLSPENYENDQAIINN